MTWTDGAETGALPATGAASVELNTRGGCFSAGCEFGGGACDPAGKGSGALSDGAACAKAVTALSRKNDAIAKWLKLSRNLRFTVQILPKITCSFD
jgi:hypothetical protein